MREQYEYTVKTIEVPWQNGAPWPYLPAQNAILDAMNEMGRDGWQVIERVWATVRPENDTLLWSVNLWAYRVVVAAPGESADGAGNEFAVYRPVL